MMGMNDKIHRLQVTFLVLLLHQIIQSDVAPDRIKLESVMKPAEQNPVCPLSPPLSCLQNPAAVVNISD